MLVVEDSLTFDDVILAPGYSEVLPRQADLSAHLTRTLKLNIPLVSAAMDTVTEAGLAIRIAEEGGIGIVHKAMSIERQASEVRRVKNFESGVVTNPITVGPETTIRDVLALTRERKISGVPVVDGDRLVGIVTGRDLRFETRLDSPVTASMTPRERLVTVREGAERDEVVKLLHEHRIEKLLVVNDAFELRGLITVKDIQKAADFPNACKDAQERLRVGAAVGTSPETDERVAALVEAGVDVIVVDTAHGHSRGVIERVRSLRKAYGDLSIIAGNIATGDAARALVDAGADAVKVGIGPGSICTTRIVAGVGVPQLTAIAGVAKALEGSQVPLIADGGIRFSGDIAKAIAAGAHCVMIGSLFAGTEQAPGDVELYQGRTYKSYRGMGSLGAMAQSHGSRDRYFQDESSEIEKLVPEGIEGRVPYKGDLSAVIGQLLGGLRASMGYTGCGTLALLRENGHFYRLSAAGIRESHVHDVNIVKEAPNYPSVM
jgi:IMP dehydrogenase